MDTDTKPIEEIVLTRVMRLNAMLHGVVAGLIVGIGIFIATNWLIFKGGEIVGPHLALLGQFFIGYTVTFVGSLIGFGYGFFFGFVVGYFIALGYNWLVEFKERASRA